MRGEPYKLGCIVISPSAYQRSLGPNYSGGLAHNTEAAAQPVETDGLDASWTGVPMRHLMLT